MVRVRLAHSARALIEAELTDSPGVETGGILLGRAFGDFVIVEHAGDPGPEADRRPRYFRRDLAHAQRLARQAWEATSAQWVGEWHSHPTSSLAPSDLDVSTYRGHVLDPELDFDVFISLIGKATQARSLIVAWAITAETVERVPIDP